MISKKMKLWRIARTVTTVALSVLLVWGCSSGGGGSAPPVEPDKVDTSTKVEATVSTNPNGTLPQTTVTTETATGDADTVVQLEIADNTQALTDMGGTPQGELNVSVVVSDHDSEKTFPEQDFTATDEGTGVYVTAGFVEISVTDQFGSAVTSFDPPMDLSVELEDGINNPETGDPLAEGDELDVWVKHNEGTDWEFFGNVQVLADLKIDLEISDLSTYSLHVRLPKIVKTTSGNGSISSGTGDVVFAARNYAAVVHGGNAAFTMTPSEGQFVRDVRVNGQSVGAVTQYTFQNVTADQTLDVEFGITGAS